MKKPPGEVRLALRQEFLDWRRWVTRALVMAFAVLAGLTVVVFTWMSERALHLFGMLQAQASWLPLLWIPLNTAAIVWLTRRYMPGAAGSGIPQVMAALEPAPTPAQRPLFVSLRLSARQDGAHRLGAARRPVDRPRRPVGADRRRRDAPQPPLAARAQRPSTTTACSSPAARPASRRPSTRRWPASSSRSRNSRAGPSSAAAA